MGEERPDTTRHLVVPRHLRPSTLHGVVVALWVVVGLMTGLGLASAWGASTLVETDDLSLTETLAMVGRHAGAWFVTAAVALGAIAVVEALLLVTGHVQHLEQGLEPEPDPEAEAVGGCASDDRHGSAAPTPSGTAATGSATPERSATVGRAAARRRVHAGPGLRRFRLVPEDERLGRGVPRVRLDRALRPHRVLDPRHPPRAQRAAGHPPLGWWRAGTGHGHHGARARLADPAVRRPARVRGDRGLGRRPAGRRGRRERADRGGPRLPGPGSGRRRPVPGTGAVPRGHRRRPGTPDRLVAAQRPVAGGLGERHRARGLRGPAVEPDRNRPYIGGPSIDRYETVVRVRVVTAHTGRPVDSFELRDLPRECQPTEYVSTVRLDGEVPFSAVSQRIGEIARRPATTSS